MKDREFDFLNQLWLTDNFEPWFNKRSHAYRYRQSRWGKGGNRKSRKRIKMNYKKNDGLPF
jgi:hypothetical protein